MLAAERAMLVSGWIEHNTRRVDRDAQNVFHEVRGKDNFWAWEQLNNLSRNDPDLCWEIILEILHTPHHQSVDWNLAAGPLEDLLAKHGVKFIAKVESRARSDPKFKELLGGVWRNVTASEVWARVEAARGEPWRAP